MIPRDRRRRALFIGLALTAALAGCQDAHVRLGVPPPSGSSTPVASAVPAPPNPGSIPGGEVRALRGETIYDVSQRTGAPVRDLIDANHLQPPYRLATGRMLIVPRTPTHVVRRGETLYSIASAEGVELYSLARMNELTPPFAVTPGQVLMLPPRVARPLIAASLPPAPPPDKPDIGVTALAPVTAQPIAPPGASPSALPAPPPAKPEVASLPPSSSPGTEAPSAEAPPPSRGGRFLWPVHGTIIGSFGASASGIHNDGINIAAPKGTPVRAADAGVVEYAGNELRGYGNLILIKHPGGWMTAYAHNATILVKRGEAVKRGQEIAKVGATGIASQPQLHFEIRRGTQVLDPVQYLSASQASGVR